MRNFARHLLALTCIFLMLPTACMAQSASTGPDFASDLSSYTALLSHRLQCMNNFAHLSPVSHAQEALLHISPRTPVCGSSAPSNKIPSSKEVIPCLKP